MTSGRSEPLSERFEANVDRSPGQGPDGSCHLWTAYRMRVGYGTTSEGSLMLLAHRVAWELENGPIPDGLHCLHHCDNRPCVNVEHLFLGTNADNMADMKAKGRAAKGSDHWRAKLTEEDIPQIRMLVAIGFTQAYIAGIYGVATSQIHNVKTRKTWGHVK
jgi:hypothetical protein